MKYIAPFLITIICAASAAAQDLKPYFAEVAQHWQVPQAWVEAISEVESSFNPWALNVAGQSFYFDTKDAAVMAAQEAQNAGKSFDSGIMQVNNFWLKKYDIDLETAFDPLANIYLGGFILQQEIKRLSLNAKAIGAYHSPNPDKARFYANKVLAVLENNSDKPVTAKQPEKSRQPPAPKVAPTVKETTLAAMAVKGNSAMKVISKQ